MHTKPIQLLLLIVLALLLTNCGSDDNVITDVDPQQEQEQKEDPVEEPTPDPAEELAAERQNTLDQLTNTDKKVWKITEAILTNSKGTIDISTNFNVIDDEIIFINSVFESSKTDFNGTLEWRTGNIINTLGSTLEETLLDYYESPAKFAFDFVGDSSVDLESASAGFTFTYVDENTITGTLTGEETATIAISLAPKTASDYVQIPTAPLNFTHAFTYASNAVAGFAPGMVGSNSSNSIFIVTREGDMRGETGINPERVTRFDINSSNQTDKLFFQSDFVSKQLHIIDNKLKVVGGQYINTYDQNLVLEPTTESYDGEIFLSRHGSAVLNDEIYIVGGSLDGTQTMGDEIFKWDDINANLSTSATMPETRSGARAEIVQNKIYVFGGTEEFVGQQAKNTIYIYDFETTTLTIEELPVGLHFTYTGKQENLIFVAGQIKSFTDDADGDGIIDEFITQSDIEPYVGVYDTNTNTFTELQTDLNSPEFETIHSMAIINGKMYVLYGQSEEIAEGEFQNWDVLVADLN